MKDQDIGIMSKIGRRRKRKKKSINKSIDLNCFINQTLQKQVKAREEKKTPTS